MIPQKYKSYFLIMSLVSFFGYGLNAATVMSLADDGGPNTLRSVISSALSGETITFNVSGTILLEEARGELVIDKQLTINGGNQIIIDGDDLINICFHIINTGSVDASNSVITNIAIQNFNGHDVGPGSGTASQELDAFGILIGLGVVNCSIINTTIKNIHAGIGILQEAVGIKSFGVLDEVVDNIIFGVSSEDNVGGRSGRVAGMLLFGGVSSNISNNTMYDISSGSASIDSGNAFGMFLASQVNGDISNNIIHDIASGSAGNNSGNVYGMFVQADLDQNISHNTIYNLSSGSASNFSATIFGLLFNGVINGNVDGNTIHHLTGGSSPGDFSGWAHGVQFANVVNGNVVNNTIHHLLGNSTGPSAGYVSGLECYSTMNGSISNNAIYELHNTASSDDTSFIVGMTFYSSVNNNVSDNTIHTLSSGLANSDSGPVYGIFFGDVVTGALLNNTFYDLFGGDAGITAGDVAGLIFFSDLNGDLLHNNLYNLVSGAADNSLSVHAVFVTGTLDGNCSYNTIEHLVMGSAPNSVETMGGIKLSSVTDGSIIECNRIVDLVGSNDTVFGVEVTEGDSLIICNNTISGLQSTNAPVHGVLLGSDVTFVTNSLIFCNVISDIFASNNDGFGITVTGSGSVGNDILNNSLFDINDKVINILTFVDAEISIESVFCFDGCKLTVKVSLESLLGSEIGSEIEVFLVQFFVSDSKKPSQAKTFIGEQIVPAGNHKVRFVPVAPVTFGQYITATATALPLGSDEENNNTSEVSNALSACKPISTFCPVFPGVSSDKPCQVMVSDETCAGCN